MSTDPGFAANRAFYDPLWSAARLIPPEAFPTWPLIAELAASGACLEIGPGVHPRLPLDRGVFLDASPAAAARLRAAGARAVVGSLAALPWPAACFALIVALDVIEHVADDARAVAELARVAAPGAALLVSVPIGPEHWSRFDAAVGHARRYDPPAFAALLAGHGWRIEASAPFGLRPRLPGLAALGVWMLARFPRLAMRWYDRMLPRALARAPRLVLAPGLAAAGGRSEGMVVLARRDGGVIHD